MRYFKDVLKAFRVNENLTQRELAGLLGTTYQTIQQYEHGKREPHFLFILKMKKQFPTIDLNTFLDVVPLPKDK